MIFFLLSGLEERPRGRLVAYIYIYIYQSYEMMRSETGFSCIILVDRFSPSLCLPLTGPGELN